MPRKVKLYLDTSIPNAYFDANSPYRQEITKQFWSKLGDYQVFVSELTIREINATQNEELRGKLLELIKDCERLSARGEEVRRLAEEYVLRGIIPVNYITDAIHIAVAVINALDVLVSWNYQHIVKLKTKRGVNAINVLLGYNPIEIVDPAML